MLYANRSLLPILLVTILLLNAGNNYNYYFIEPANARLPAYEGDPILRDTDLKVEIFAEGLEKPTSMAFLGSNDILVLEQANGTVKRIVNGTIQPQPVLDVSVANKSERGMLGIAVSKHENGTTYVFLYYTEAKVEGSDICPKPNRCEPGTEPLGNRLYRYELVNNSLVNPMMLLDLPAVPGPAHNGGKVVIGPDNNVYLTIGDVGYRSSTQNFPGRSDFNGTSAIYRITQDGQPLPDNPFGSDADPPILKKYYAYGLRNSFGIAFDPVTGKLWDTENGAAYGDEINLVEPGFNSGWRKLQGIWETEGTTVGGKVMLNSSAFKQKADPNSVDLENFDGKGKYSDPAFIWFNNSAPTGLTFLHSDTLGKHHQNHMFVGDFNAGNIYRFELNQTRTGFILDGSLADKIEQSPEELSQILFGQGFDSITDLQVSPEGYLYILSYGDGNIYRIVPATLDSQIQNGTS
jgi:glucose/arabinose dehydrogenase